MRHLPVALLLLAPAAFAQDHIAPTAALSPADELTTFRLPPGYEAQLVASDPAIGKPMQMAFDAKGRLWVATSKHYPHPATGPASDVISILSDIDPITGKAGKVAAFARDLNIPIGILPLPDCASCLVSEVGRILKLTDTDGDGVADKRETILEGFGYADTHGMANSFVLMPDGWVYACHGFANTSKVTAKDGSTVAMHSGNTFRFRPDGSRVEPFTRGQVNPFGLTLDSAFHFYTSDSHSSPATQLIPGATYQSFSKPHDGLGFAPHAAAHDHGSTALAGLCYLESDTLPADMRGALVLGNVVTHRVNRDRVRRVGSTPVAEEMPDLLASSDPWFRPVDIKLGPDGAVYVSDFYNKIIGHYEVDLSHPERDHARGRIWRIVYTGPGAARVGRLPDFAAMITAELDDQLASKNIAVRMLALHQLKRRGEPLPARKHATPEYLSLRLWLGDDAPVTPEPELVTLHRVRRGMVLSGGATPAVARAWVDGVSLNPKPEAWPTLAKIALATPAEDTHLTHAVKVAARGILAVPGGLELFAQSSPEVRAKLGGALLGMSTAGAAALVAARPELTRDACAHVGRHGSPESVALAASTAAKRPAGEAVECLEALASGRQSAGQSLPADCGTLAGEVCDRALSGTPTRAQMVAAGKLALALKLTRAAERFGQIASDSAVPLEVRLDAALTLADLDPERAEPLLAAWLADPQAPAREKVSEFLGRINRPAAHATLAAALPGAPDRLRRSLASALATWPGGAESLAAAIESGKAPASLLTLRPVRDRLVGSAKGELKTRIDALAKGAPAEDARLAELLKTRQAGYRADSINAAAGAKLYTTHCAACHQLGGQGGKVGPQLDGVGNRGAERLLEDILAPSRNVDAAFRATVLTTVDGRTITGLVLREEGAVTVIADAAGQEVRVPKGDIESRRVVPQSPMPANFDTLLTPAELASVVGYLVVKAGK